MKIIKFVATRCQIFKLKCTKFNFGWGSAPDPAGGALRELQRSPDPQPQYGVLLLRGGEGKGRVVDGKGKGRVGDGKGKGR